MVVIDRAHHDILPVLVELAVARKQAAAAHAFVQVLANVESVFPLEPFGDRCHVQRIFMLGIPVKGYCYRIFAWLVLRLARCGNISVFVLGDK